MKFLSIVLFLNLTVVLCFSQSTQLDSLRKELNNEKHPDSIKISLLLDLSFEFRFSNPDSMFFYANNARLLGLELGNIYGSLQGLRNIALSYLNKGEFDTAKFLLKKVIEESSESKQKKILLDAYNSLGRIYYSKADYDSAITIFRYTLDLSKELKEPIDRAGALLNIGGTLQEKGEEVKATRYFNEALLVFDSLNNQYGVATAYYNLANIFKNQGDYNKSLRYYLKVAKIDSTSGNTRDFAATLGSIADIMLYKKDTAKAILTYRKSISLYDESSSHCQKVISINNLGDLYLSLNLIDSAEKYITQALEIATECEMPKQIAAIRFDLGKFYSQALNTAFAKDNFLIAYKIAEEHSLKKLMGDAALKLYEIYSLENNIEQSLFYLEKVRNIENELFNKANTRKIAQMEAAYEMEKERQKFQFQQEKAEIEYQKNIAEERSLKYQILFGFIILSVLLVVILSLYFQKNKLNYKLEKIVIDTNEQNQQIKEQNEEISQQAELIEKRSKELEQQKRELELTNNKLTRLNEDKNTIIGIVAHDLKSPLNQVKGFISLLKLEQNDRQKFHEYLKLLENSANRSTQMIDRILDINALDNNTIVVTNEYVNIRTVLESVQNDYQKQADDKKIQLFLTMKDEIIIRSDSEALQEVIDNLVSNALKFSPEDSQVNISAEETSEFYSIAVQDRGPGISESDKSSIFKKYKQGSASPTANEKSTGLGLAIVKRYIDALNYDIQCESDGKSGTTFVIQIPKDTSKSAN